MLPKVLLVLALPLAEIAAFIQVGEYLGVLGTLLLIVATAVLGLIILRVQGFSIGMRWREAMARNEPPVGPLLDGLGLGIAAVLLLIPGFLTDGLGAAMAVPAVRRALTRSLLSWLRAKAILP